MSGLLGKLSPARRIDGNNDLPLFYVNQTSMDPPRRPRDTPRVSLTFAELLMNVEDARNDQSTTRQALEMASPITSSASSFDTWTSAPASSISSSPFVLSFNDLTYNVKIQKKFDPLACCGKLRNGSSVNTKILLNGISGEAHEGEMMAALGASGSSKSTLIDALANRIAKDSLGGSICWM